MTSEAGDARDTTVERGAAEEGMPLTPTEVDASRRPPSAPGPESDDVRPGSEEADRPKAGSTEPPD
jgi:hypothetical protein